jgi:hypothetical protein|tara:strand:+ start:1460 stop:1642 length:183 start_codon:yes stop_codon:yes gene_type:complete
MDNDELVKLISERAELSKLITDNDSDKLHALAKWLDLCIIINEYSPNYQELTIEGREIKS